MIAVGIDEALARSLYGGDGGDGVTEELLTGGVEEKGSRRTCVTWPPRGSGSLYLRIRSLGLGPCKKSLY